MPQRIDFASMVNGNRMSHRHKKSKSRQDILFFIVGEETCTETSKAVRGSLNFDSKMKNSTGRGGAVERCFQIIFE